MNRRFAVRLCCAVALSALSACAVSYRDGDGVLHRVGFVADTVHVDGDLVTRSDAVAGLRLDGSKDSLGFSLGFRRVQETWLVDHEEVLCIRLQERTAEQLDCASEPRAVGAVPAR